MTGLERNADLVRMASYAPLFAHVDAWQWTPDLIWFDNLKSYGTTNYYVQKLFANNVGTRIAPTRINDSLSNAVNGLYVSGMLDEGTHEAVLMAVNVNATPRSVQVVMKGISGGARGKQIVLASSDSKAENSLNDPKHVAPVMSNVDVGTGPVPMNLAADSVTVLRVPY